MFDFSEKLIEETIKCFKDENGVEFSREEAVEALSNMGCLFLVFSKINKKDSGYQTYHI